MVKLSTWGILCVPSHSLSVLARYANELGGKARFANELECRPQIHTKSHGPVLVLTETTRPSSGFITGTDINQDVRLLKLAKLVQESKRELGTL